MERWRSVTDNTRRWCPLKSNKLLQPTKSPCSIRTPLSNLHERPRLAREPRLDRGLYRCNFGFVNGYRSLAHSDDEGNPGDHKNRAPIQWVEAAENIPREKWAFDFLEPVRPPRRHMYREETIHSPYPSSGLWTIFSYRLLTCNANHG